MSIFFIELKMNPGINLLNLSSGEIVLLTKELSDGRKQVTDVLSKDKFFEERLKSYYSKDYQRLKEYKNLHNVSIYSDTESLSDMRTASLLCRTLDIANLNNSNNYSNILSFLDNSGYINEISNLSLYFENNKMELVKNKLSSSSSSDESSNSIDSNNVPKVSSPHRPDEITTKDVESYKDFYQVRYKTTLELPKILETIVNDDDQIFVNFPLIDKIIATSQLYNLKTQIEVYLKSLNKEIEQREKPQLKIRERIDEIKYLIEWFDITFTDYKTDNEESDNDEELNNDKIDDNSNTELLEKLQLWFIKHANMDDLKIFTGYYVGKRSMHVDVWTTEWLENKELYYCSTEGSNWWKYGDNWVGDDFRYSDLKNYLKPKSYDELLKAFETMKDNEESVADFMEELLKYMHCDDNIRLIRSVFEDDRHFSSFDY
jgi:hypothetical protein